MDEDTIYRLFDQMTEALRDIVDMLDRIERQEELPDALYFHVDQYGLHSLLAEVDKNADGDL